MSTSHGTKASIATVLLVTLAVLAGCSGVNAPISSSTTSGRAVLTPPAGAAAPAAPPYAVTDAAKSAGTPTARSPLADRMVIRTGNVRLEVPNTLDAVRAIRALTARYGGVVAALQVASEDGGGVQPQPAEKSGALQGVPSGLPFAGSITVLVPVARFDAFRSGAEKIGKVLSESSGDEDVTQQHADLAARLANARAEETRLRGFFSSARNVSEMLAVERELARVRGDIESMTAQLATLERQAAMATLTIELVQPLAIVRPAGVDWGFGRAVRTGFQTLARITRALIILGIALLPPIALGVGVVVGIQAVRRRLRARKASPDEN